MGVVGIETLGLKEYKFGDIGAGSIVNDTDTCNDSWIQTGIKQKTFLVSGYHHANQFSFRVFS